MGAAVNFLSATTYEEIMVDKLLFGVSIIELSSNGTWQRIDPMDYRECLPIKLTCREKTKRRRDRQRMDKLGRVRP